MKDFPLQDGAMGTFHCKCLMACVHSQMEHIIPEGLFQEQEQLRPRNLGWLQGPSTRHRPLGNLLCHFNFFYK